MLKTFSIILFCTATLFCGCDKQSKINSEKIQLLSQNIIQFEQNQEHQMALMQTQLLSIAPMFDQIHNEYFEKNRDTELLYHTNTLFLLLTIGKKIEAHLQEADAQREADSIQTFVFHTNQMDLMQIYTSQLLDAMANMENRLGNDMKTEFNRTGTNLTAKLSDQIKSATAPGAIEIARQQEVEAELAQIKQDLAQIQQRLAQLTNPPAASR